MNVKLISKETYTKYGLQIRNYVWDNGSEDWEVWSQDAYGEFENFEVSYLNQDGAEDFAYRFSKQS